MSRARGDDVTARRLDALASLLRLYRPLSNALVKDFFIYDHWHTVLPAA